MLRDFLTVALEHAGYDPAFRDSAEAVANFLSGELARNPQRLIDALEDAGVIERVGYQTGKGRMARTAILPSDPALYRVATREGNNG